MIEGTAVFAFVCALVLGPLAWRAVHDRRQARAIAVSADVRHAIDRELGGESLIAVQVEPDTIWRSGRVVLSIPSDWRWLMKATWERALATTPIGYELVVQQRETPPPPATGYPGQPRVAA
jgi:hypothetical protein